MKIQNEFSQNAKAYDTYNIIQTKVVKELIHQISDKPEVILDIGCGSGAVYRSVSWPWKKFVGIDFSEGMLALHPKTKNIELYVEDFNHSECFQKLKKNHFNRIISASALQWSEDLDHVFQSIKKLDTPVSFAIFTSGTFKTLHQTAAIPPLLRSAENVMTHAKKYFHADYKILTYTLEFSSVRDMFRYMKKSGVSGARNILSFKQMKRLMNNYPLNYLEFEILIIHENSLKV